MAVGIDMDICRKLECQYYLSEILMNGWRRDRCKRQAPDIYLIDNDPIHKKCPNRNIMIATSKLKVRGE